MSDARVPITGVAYPTFYVADLAAARAHWERLLGPVEYEDGALCGLRLGDGWLTLVDARHGPHPGGGPRNTELALRVASAADVDALHARLLALGATTVIAPADTRMYEPMRYACVDDPFGVRLGIYFPRPAAPGAG